MKLINFLFLYLVLIVHNVQSQCYNETITICDMTQIDYDSDGELDGIINLYDTYNAIPGVTPITTATGAWFDPNFNFALDESNGELHLWDLSNSSSEETTYQFQIIDTSSTCLDGIVINLNIILGPFSGYAIPTVGTNGVNIEICDYAITEGCSEVTSFDLFQALGSTPNAHANGNWSYLGTSPNFIEIEDGRYLVVDIPYQPGPPLVDDESFELVYTVPGITPCAISMETHVKVSVIRGVFSGAHIEDSGLASSLNVCESELINGDYNSDINLRDDSYLVNEDVEGLWSSFDDPTNQISNPGDSFVNLKTIYDDLILTSPRFKNRRYLFNYNVDSRSNVCFDQESIVVFLFVESIRPFSQEEPEEICIGDEGLTTLDLYDLITFTSENGVLFDYPDIDYTNWSFISGPSNLSLNGSIINIADITNANSGTYTFEFSVFDDYNFNADFSTTAVTFETPDGCLYSQNSNSPCAGKSTQVTLILHPYNYPGEDTMGLNFCETDLDTSIDLFSLLETNGEDAIYLGTGTHWTNEDTSETIDNPFVFPEIDGEQTFSFKYHISKNGCLEEADLSFTVYEQYDAGTDGVVNVCVDDSTFDLFDKLNGIPDDNGTWSGPNNFLSSNHSVNFNPDIFEAGDYIYTVPNNTQCMEKSATVTVHVHPLSNAGDDFDFDICKSDNQVDLFDILDSQTDLGGTFIDVGLTNALTGSVLDLQELTNGNYSFQYEVQPNTACVVDTALITVSVIEVEKPISLDQEFCVGIGATVSDLEVDSSEYYYWYDNEDDTDFLNQDTLLKNNEDYYVVAIDDDGCKSEYVKISVTLIPFGEQGCVSCINDGVSPNDDSENDTLELCNLPNVFPNFEIEIFNRFGNAVYLGTRNTPLFNGTSNTSFSLGNELPAGVYFYIFTPNNELMEAFQGDFYLSR